jgi:hypothetical protein
MEENVKKTERHIDEIAVGVTTISEIMLKQLKRIAELELNDAKLLERFLDIEKKIKALEDFIED